MRTSPKSQNLRTLLKNVIPSPALNTWRRGRYWIQAKRNQSPEDVFSAIYKANTWGGAKGIFYSGDGTRDPKVSEPYVEAVRTWLNSIDANALAVVDLGCGDFSIGSRITDLCASYTGVDVVPDLIAHNQASFGSHNVHFRHLDITRDPLPDGDVCIIRQVLQHLSNAQIALILPKLDKYNWVLISEHHPFEDEFTRPNVDKPANAGTLIVFGSGVYLGAPPFDRVAQRLNVLPELPLEGGVLRTYPLEPREALTSVV